MKFGSQCRRRPGFTENTKCLKCVASKVKCDYAGLRSGAYRRGKHTRDGEEDGETPPRKKATISIKKPALPTIRIIPRPTTRSGVRTADRNVEEAVEPAPAVAAEARVSPEPRARWSPPPVSPF